MRSGRSRRAKDNSTAQKEKDREGQGPGSGDVDADDTDGEAMAVDTGTSGNDKERCPMCKPKSGSSVSGEPKKQLKKKENEKRDGEDQDEQGPEDAVDEAGKESWVRCDACKRWFHWRCAGEGGALDLIDKWFCPPCIASDSRRTITVKQPTRKSSRKRAPRDYASLHAGIGVGVASPGGLLSDVVDGPGRWHALLREKEASGGIVNGSGMGGVVRIMRGADVTREWLDTDETALREPVLVESPEGLGMEMPAPGLTVSDVADIVGPDTPVEVMDVATQSNTPGYTLARWSAYYNTSAEQRDRIRNVISLEISDTPLGERIVPPRLVRDVDWVSQYWPSSRYGRGHAYPKVQLYCLMGVAGAWTDWHIDFAGSSVYYHIFHGAKAFYFIRPTPANLAAYERWSGSDLQTNTWLGDLVDTVYKVELCEGNTMIIPSGWIHAVYTPVDTLVFGGNFLHSYNIATQLRVREIESATRVPKKFQFPFFAKLCWYVAEASLRSLKAREEFPPRVLTSLYALASFLVRRARAIERGGEEAKKKEAREEVPADKVRDAPALARELRWRLRMAMGVRSDGEEDEVGVSLRGVGAVVASGKRKRGESTTAMSGHLPKTEYTRGKGRRESEIEDQNGEDSASSRFRHFVPKRWDAYRSEAVTEGQKRQQVSHDWIPYSDLVDGNGRADKTKSNNSWTERWMRWDASADANADEEGVKGDGESAKVSAAKEEDETDAAVPVALDEFDVERRHEVLVRVRRTAKGLERQRIERTVELWERAE